MPGADRPAERRLAGLIAELDLGLDPAAARIDGADPILPCRYPLGESSAAVQAAVGLAAARLWELRGGEPQAVRADVRHGAALLRGFLDQVVDGELLDPDPTGKLDLVGLFEAGDGGWVQTYGVFDPLRARTLEVLGCEPDRASVARAIAAREAEEVSEALNAAGAPAATARSAADWAEHDHGRVLAATPVVSIERVGDAPPRPLPAGDRPLAGLRVVDLTRIVAGPACGRTLAEHGADVLQVGTGRLPSIHRALVDTTPGKRLIELDLDRPADREALDGLLADADVLCQSARPGSFARRGLGPEDLADGVPGIVYASTDCYGAGGPWSERAGFEPLAQASTGWAVDHAHDGRPQIVAGLACDYTTGFLLALGVMHALARRATEGGSWHVRTSLCRTAMWLRDQDGRFDPAAAPGLDARATADLRCAIRTPFGRVEQLRPGVGLSLTPPSWAPVTTS